MFKKHKLKLSLKSLKSSDSSSSSKKNEKAGAAVSTSKSSARESSNSLSSKMKIPTNNISLPLTGNSNTINSKMLDINEVCRYGLNGKITAMGYDQNQSLLALATDTSEIHVYGKQQVEVVFTFENDGGYIKDIRFIKGIYLVCLDSKDTVIVLSLYSQKLLASFFVPGKVSSMDTDPTLDWVLLGLQSGNVLIYDVDRDCISQVRVINLQKDQFFPKEKSSEVVSLQWNPRNYGQILISYDKTTVIYSLLEEKVKQHFIYQLPAYAPGGDGQMLSTPRYPKIKQSLFHPNGLHVLTVHEDNSLCFWDANSGKLLLARSLYDVDVNVPAPNTADIGGVGLAHSPIKQVSWICKKNPEYTSLLIAGGDVNGSSSSNGSGCHSLTMLDLGGTPLYSMTTYDKMKDYYSNPKDQRIFPIPNSSSIVNFICLSRASPFFAGNHDPGVILVLLEDGEIESMLYPTGSIIYKASILPQSISWVRPFATIMTGCCVPNKAWLGMMSSIYNKDSILKGGDPAKKDLRVHELRSALATGHVNGSVRIWDASYGELDESSVFDVNISQVLNRADVNVTNISFAPETCELAIGCKGGDVVLYKFDENKFYDPSGANQMNIAFKRFTINKSNPAVLVDVRDRAPSTLKEGFVPISVIHASAGEITTVKNSEIGFVCVGYENGIILVVDRRGPAVILNENIKKFSMTATTITSVQFTIMQYGDENYSSILMLCGTDSGEILAFKILPDSNGRFSVKYHSSAKCVSRGAIHDITCYSKNGIKCLNSSFELMKQLPTGVLYPGVCYVSGGNEIATFIPGMHKPLNRKSLRAPIISSNIATLPFVNSKGQNDKCNVCIVLTFDHVLTVFSTPELKEIKRLSLKILTQSKYVGDSFVLSNGDIILRVSQTEARLISILAKIRLGSKKNNDERDKLYNALIPIPYRPQYNSLQWARGDINVRREDLDLLLGGDSRPKSKYEESIIANGSYETKAKFDSKNKKGPNYEQFSYEPPVRRNGAVTGVGYSDRIARMMENGYDTMESTIDQYATVAGDSLNQAFEDTGNSLLKGAFKSKFGI
ncbi:uncharacterized protein SCDLUD_000122 [Saccharomycodes ludwigii]|uniref:uncharacterized protein n=1 Tax=Saccharomycodes ludwigii TaxID=36035 RepID=UPI001E8A128C|nr:hypothetical protein SCDLUD_000122 [Saccharomycodes ludwigii]KAH3902543.1 hypothetical protein SCDLUD_000122 [Saccharomycodes ludwigii]